MKVVILAGGGGTRLWPLSRAGTPKQIQPFLDKQTLLQKTFARVRKGFPTRDIFVSTHAGCVDLVRKQLKQLPKNHLFVEPVRRDTAAAIGLCAALLYRENPKTIFTTANSDHFIKNEKEYVRALKVAETVVKKHPSRVVLLGINPSYAETGYGYIRIGKPIFQTQSTKHKIQNKLKAQSTKSKNDGDSVFEVQAFIEKPSPEKAKEFLGSWEYLWNPAMFVWRADTLLNLYKRHLPKTYRILMRIAEDPKRIAEEFPLIEPISIDYGILEKVKDLLVIPADFGWSDIGHWKSIYDALAGAQGDNVVRGKHVGLESAGNLIYSMSGKMVTTIGVHDMIVVETDDAMLLCPKDRAQEVKKLVQELERRELREYL